jgi:hypothetical protein
VLTIVRAFMLASSPRAADPINGYAGYCAMVRDPLMWLGCTDPCKTMEKIRKQDSRLGTLYQIAAQWLEVIGKLEKTAADIVALANKRRPSSDPDDDDPNPLVYPEFRAALAEVVRGKNLDSWALGRWLRGVSGQIITLGAKRYRFSSREDSHLKIALWSLHEA